MANKFFVNQKRHKVGAEGWSNTVYVEDTKEQALHRFFKFFDTYAYGYAPEGQESDYVACDVTDLHGLTIRPMEIWNVMPEEVNANESEG